MPLRETEAIVLRTYRLGEADKIVSLLTRQFGRLRAVAAGSQRARSRYGGTLEPLSYIKVWLFERENRDLLRMNSAELLESFFDMQKEYLLQVSAQYVAEVCERILPEREVSERVFRLLLMVLHALKHSGQAGGPLLYFNYWMLRLAGVLPNLEKCLACAQAFGDAPGYYSESSEGLLCTACRSTASRVVSSSAREWVMSAHGLPLDRWLASQRPPADCREARLFLEQLIEAHIEKKLVTRALLSEDV